MLDSEKKLNTESFELNGSEKEARFDRTNEVLEWDKFWRIKEIKLEREWETSDSTKKMFQFIIDDASKTLTVNKIKEIMCEEYGYNKDALSVSVIGKSNVDWDTVCTSDDIIHVVLDVRTPIWDWEPEDEGTTISDNNGHESDIQEESVDDNLEQGWESPYKEMIERQTHKEKLRYWDRNKPELTITIDDGNKYKDVKAILDILKEENIKATFFVKWNRLNRKDKDGNLKELRIKAKDQWHQICCHTYSHIYLSGDSDETILPSSWEEGSPEDWSKNVKRLLWEKRYREIEVSERGKWINFPKSVSSDVLLETEILMWEAELKNILWEEEWEEYLKKYKRDFPFIRLPWWDWLRREKNIAVLRRMWYLSIYWSDDFLHEKDDSGKRPHYTLDEMRVQNWWIPLFHFKWAEEQNYIRQYIHKAKKMGKSFKPLSDVIVPTN